MEETIPGIPLSIPSKTAGLESLLVGWSDLGNVWLLLDMVIVLAVALFLGAAIAYHPSTRKRVTNLELWEQPKALLMYAMVAAVVALLVQVEPAMALVVFGIGGLLRFRTIVGAPHHTARVILVTVVGLCCGLKIFVVALPATIIGWLVIYVLNFQRVGTIRVSGVTEANIYDATLAYREAIRAAGCELVGEKAKFMKREFHFVVKAPESLDTERLKLDFDGLPEGLRGVVSFDKL